MLSYSVSYLFGDFWVFDHESSSNLPYFIIRGLTFEKKKKYGFVRDYNPTILSTYKKHTKAVSLYMLKCSVLCLRYKVNKISKSPESLKRKKNLLHYFFCIFSTFSLVLLRIQVEPAHFIAGEQLDKTHKKWHVTRFMQR